ncbi:hypothetical protein PV326_006460 [Microctonus aethiopoides]|nr:hypothetical protein PV326_006460 [Microctonus aethiopoides]
MIFSRKYRRTLRDPTYIAEDSLQTCNVECTEELNAYENEKIMDQEEFPFQQQASRKSEAACINDGNEKFTSSSLAPCDIKEEIKPEDR